MTLSGFEDWMQTTERSNSKTTRAVHEQEIAQRAAVLAKLGYDKKLVELRIRQNLRWEFARLGKAASEKRVAALVTEAFRRAGRVKKKR